MFTNRQIVSVCAAILLSLLTATASAQAQSKKQQKGKASYYSRRANGARTSSGERLHNDSLVCAHRTYPFGTKLLVKNPANGKEVIVRVIDRGPFGRGRIIDLSYEAARRIGMLSAGVAMVEVSVYDDTEVPYKPKEYTVPELELEMNGGSGTTPEWQVQKKRQAEEAKLEAQKLKEKSEHAHAGKEMHAQVSNDKHAHTATSVDGKAIAADAEKKVVTTTQTNKKKTTRKRANVRKRRR